MPHDDPYVGQHVNADWAYYLDTAGSYTPTLGAATTTPNLGADGVALGEWNRNGHVIHAWVFFLFSGTGVSAGSGAYFFDPPFDVDGSLPASAAGSPTTGRMAVGSGFAVDSGTAANTRVVSCQLWTAQRIGFFYHAANSFITDSAPFTWASGDILQAHITYRADPNDLP